jgi:hypothetical protein
LKNNTIEEDVIMLMGIFKKKQKPNPNELKDIVLPGQKPYWEGVNVAQEDIVPDNHVTMDFGNKLYFHTLDLNQDFHNISQQLDNIVNSIRQ